MFDSPRERQFVARAMFERVTSPRSPLDRVGALSEVRVPAADGPRRRAARAA